MRSLLSGSARATRLAENPPDRRSEVVTSVASGLFSPLVFLFVWWVLTEARSKGIKRLYFLARDGFVLKETADILIDVWKLDIDARYLHCSRESLLLPSFNRVGEFELHWTTWGYLGSITLSEVCNRLLISPDSFRAALQGSATPDIFKEPDLPLSPEGLALLKSLLQQPTVEQLVRNNNLESYEAAVGYLKQQGFNDGVSYALVDTGWRGTSQYALSLILDRAGYRPASGITGLYLGLNRGTETFGNDRLSAFLFDWNNCSRDYRLYNFICFEMLFASGVGRTVGYNLVASRYEPVFAEIGTGELDFAWVVKVLHRSARRYASYISRALAFEDFEPQSASLARSMARAFISSPEFEEANVFGDYQIASEILERDMQCIAPPLSYQRLISIACGKDRINGFWPQGSMARSNLRAALGAYRFFLDLKLLDLYRRFLLKC